MPGSLEDFHQDFKQEHMKKSTFLIVVFTLLISLGCKTRDSISGYYSYETECLSKNFSGSQTVKAWATGKNVREAKTRAYQEALRDIIFKGIRNGNPDCDLIPLITEVNAREKYEVYFDHFFSKKGIYTKFISPEKEGRLERNTRSNYKEAYAYIIEVDIPALKNQLKNDEIIR